MSCWGMSNDPNSWNQFREFYFPTAPVRYDFDFTFNFSSSCKISYFRLAKVACSSSFPLLNYF